MNVSKVDDDNDDDDDVDGRIWTRECHFVLWGLQEFRPNDFLSLYH